MAVDILVLTAIWMTGERFDLLERNRLRPFREVIDHGFGVLLNVTDGSHYVYAPHLENSICRVQVL